jgi:hypothetical protein
MPSTLETRSLTGEPNISPLAGKPAPKEMLVNVVRLERDYFERRPDVQDLNQLVIFGTSAGPECGSCSGVDASGMVVTSGARDCSIAGSAQLGQRSSYDRAWSCRWELALARPRRHAVLSGFSMAAGFDGELKALSRPYHIR